MGALTLVATVVLWWQADALVALQFPRFAPETQALTVRLTRIVLPAQIFFIAGGILRAALMVHGRFATQALAPILLQRRDHRRRALARPAAWAPRASRGARWLGAAFGALGVAWLDARFGLRSRARMRVAPFDPQVLHYLAVAAPLMLGLSLTTTDEWYDRWFGALLASGTVAHLAYARRLMQLPVAVVGQAIATAALPTLSRLWSEGQREELDDRDADHAASRARPLRARGRRQHRLRAADRRGRLPRGAFGADDAAAVALLLQAFSIGVPAWVLQQIAVRAFYARNDTWRPMLLGTVVSLGSIPLYLVARSALGRRRPRVGGRDRDERRTRCSPCCSRAACTAPPASAAWRRAAPAPP